MAEETDIPALPKGYSKVIEETLPPLPSGFSLEGEAKKKNSDGTLTEPSVISEESVSESISPTEPYKYSFEEIKTLPKAELKPVKTFGVTTSPLSQESISEAPSISPDSLLKSALEKENYGDTVGAIKEIDTAIPLTEDPAILSRLWQHKERIFGKLAQPKKLAEKYTDIINDVDTTHDETDKGFYGEKHKEAADNVQKYEMQVANAQSSLTTSGAGQAKPTKTVSEVKEEGGKPTFENYIVSGVEKLGEYLKVHGGEQLVGGAVKLAKAIGKEETVRFDSEGNRVDETGKKINIPTITDKVSNALDGFIGAAETAFGAVSFTPVGVAFNVVAENFVPEKVNEWLFASAHSVAEKIGYHPKEGSIGEKALTFGDIVVPLLITHGAAKAIGKDVPLTAKDINEAASDALVEKIKNKEPLNPAEAQQVADVVAKTTPEDLRNAIAENKDKIKPQYSIENKVVNIVEKSKEGKDINKDIAKLDVDKEKFDEVIDIARSGEQISDIQAKELKESFDDIQKAKEVIPEEHRINPTIVSLVAEKNKLQEAKKNIDESFHPALNEKIDGIKNKILEIINPELIKPAEVASKEEPQIAKEVVQEPIKAEVIEKEIVTEAKEPIIEPKTEEVVKEVVKEKPFKTADKKYTVTKSPEGLKITGKRGKKISATTEAKVIKEYEDFVDYTKGKKAEDIAKEEKMEFKDPDESNRYVAEKSESPIEIIKTYESLGEFESKKSYINQIMDDYVTKIDPKSYNMFGDRNNIGIGMAKRFFKKGGKKIDTLAEEISEVAGKEVTPQDIVEFIEKDKYERKISPTQAALRERFKQLTGLTLNDRVSQKARTQELNKSIKDHEQYLNKESLSFEQAEREYYDAISRGEIPIEEPTGIRPVEGVGEVAERAKPTEAAREQLKSSAKELGDKFKDLFNDELGIIYDPKRDAQKLYDFHVALVKTARDAIKLGVATAKDFADSIGRKLDKFTERAWEDAQKQERGEPPFIKTPKDFEKTFTLEEGKEVRGFAESVKEAKPEMIEEINKNPELQYEKQNLKEVKENLADMTDEQKLEKMNEIGKFASIESGDNFGVLAGIDLINKYIAEGKDPTPILEQLSKAGTTMGQLIRQFAELKGSTPESVLMVFEKELAKKDRTLTEGQKDILKELSKADIEARAKYNEQKKKAESEYTEDNMKELERLKKEAEKKYKTLATYMMDITPKDFWETSGIMLQGNLLTPMSIITNPFSNALLIPLRIAEKALVAPIDALYSYVTGKPRAVTMEGTVAGLKGFGMGAAEAAKQIWTGLDVSDLKKAEVQRGFRPLRSLVQAWTGKDMPLNAKGKIPVGDRAMKVYEGILGAPPEIMFRLLSLGDKPFLRMAEQSSLARIAKSKGLKGEAFEKFMRFPDKKSYEEMQKSGQEATFQEESKAAGMVSSGMKQLAKVPFVGGAFKFLAKTQMPYIKTPTNIISQTLDYAVPPISLAKALYHASKKNRREALINLGKFGVGTMMIQAADFLYDNDIISPSPDERGKEKQRALRYQVFPPNSINLSALERLKKGESTEPREGDEFMSYSKMGVLGAIINMRANLGEKGWQEGKEGRDKDAMGYLHSMVASFPDLASYSLEQSFLQGTTNLLEAIKDKEWDNWIANTFNAVSSIPLPNTLAALNRVDREYIPSLTGDDLEERLSNVIKNKTFQADGIPLKINLWGEKIKQTPEGSNAWLYQMFDVTKMQEINDNKLSKTIYDLWRRTQDADVIPTIPTRNITIGENSIRLTQKQYQDLLTQVGHERKKKAEKFIESEIFAEKDDEAKIKKLKKKYEIAREGAFYDFKKELVLTKEQEEELGENLGEVKRKLKRK